MTAENALTGNVRRYELSVLPKVTVTDRTVPSVALTGDLAMPLGLRLAGQVFWRDVSQVTGRVA